MEWKNKINFIRNLESQTCPCVNYVYLAFISELCYSHYGTCIPLPLPVASHRDFSSRPASSLSAFPPTPTNLQCSPRIDYITKPKINAQYQRMKSNEQRPGQTSYDPLSTHPSSRRSMQYIPLVLIRKSKPCRADAWGCTSQRRRWPSVAQQEARETYSRARSPCDRCGRGLDRIQRRCER